METTQIRNRVLRDGEGNFTGMQLQSRHRPYTGTGFGDWSDWAEVPTEDPDAPAA